ncbi:MAG: methylated-DNA--[protein]-cysteine S-methyltransferase [Alphaproteobacteria bacterium]|nr:methylated-DNA--[protein]-cysteine S-methyltransferase [Alphaproteobacteria bacterium]
MAYLVVSSPLGDLTIFEDGGAIVSLDFGRAPNGKDSPSALLKRAAKQLDDYFDGRRKAFDLPLKPAGTPFQKRVWARLAAIPSGQTATYGAIAARLKSGARAVGTACGANPIPILIPCHRVLGAGGRMGGYSGEGGVATKRRLLEHEGADV